MINAEKLIVDSIDLVTCFSPSTGELNWMIDQVTDGTLTNGSETVYGAGKNGVNLSALDRNKSASFTLNNGYIVGGVIAAQTGTAAVKASVSSPLKKVPTHDIITVAANETTAKLSKTPVGVTGAEVKFVYPLVNGVQDRKLEVDTAPEKGKSFKIDAASKTLTFATGEFTADTEIIVFYDYDATEGSKYSNSSNTFSKGGKVVLDLTCRDICDNDVIYHTKFVYPNAKIDGNFDIAIGDTPAVHAITGNALASICSTNKTLWDWYIVE